MTGLKGNLGDKWSFDVYGSYDGSLHNSVMHNAVLKTRVQTLLNAADGGRSICAGGFNPFGDANARNLSPACAAYMSKDAISSEDLTQTQLQAQVNGKLFDLGAGAAQVALVADYRRNTYAYTPDADVTALSGWAPAANVEAFTAASPVTPKSIDVKEFAAQFDVPLIADRPFMRELAVGAAARVSRYSVSGSVNGYEGDARWRPVDQLLFRGSYQRAVRAPNIGELLSPLGADTQLVIGTPPGHNGRPVRQPIHRAGWRQRSADCSAVRRPGHSIGAGQHLRLPHHGHRADRCGQPDPHARDGQYLQPRVGIQSGVAVGRYAFTRLLQHFDQERDLDHPRPHRAIQVLQPGWFEPGLLGGRSLCQALQRDTSTGQLLTVATPYANLGGLKTDGIELQVHWGFGVPAVRTGRFYIDSAISNLNSYRVQILPGAPFLNYTGVSVGGTNPGSVPPRSTPKIKGLTTFGYRTEALTAGLRWRYQNSMKDVSAVLTPNNVQVGVPTYQLWDVFGTYKFGSGLQLRAGVNNLLDRDLPIVASSQNSTDTALYDPIGRYYYLGLNLTF